MEGKATEAAARYGVSIHGYCLMENHHHLLVNGMRERRWGRSERYLEGWENRQWARRFEGWLRGSRKTETWRMPCRRWCKSCAICQECRPDPNSVRRNKLLPFRMSLQQVVQLHPSKYTFWHFLSKFVIWHHITSQLKSSGAGHMKIKANVPGLSVLFVSVFLTVILFSILIADTQGRSLNDRGDFVWQGFDGNDWEIFLYSNGIITQITDNEYDDLINIKH